MCYGLITAYPMIDDDLAVRILTNLKAYGFDNVFETLNKLDAATSNSTLNMLEKCCDLTFNPADMLAEIIPLLRDYCSLPKILIDAHKDDEGLLPQSEMVTLIKHLMNKSKPKCTELLEGGLVAAAAIARQIDNTTGNTLITKTKLEEFITKHF